MYRIENLFGHELANIFIWEPETRKNTNKSYQNTTKLTTYRLKTITMPRD